MTLAIGIKFEQKTHSYFLKASMWFLEFKINRDNTLKMNRDNINYMTPKYKKYGDLMLDYDDRRQIAYTDLYSTHYLRIWQKTFKKSLKYTSSLHYLCCVECAAGQSQMPLNLWLVLHDRLGNNRPPNRTPVRQP